MNKDETTIVNKGQAAVMNVQISDWHHRRLGAIARFNNRKLRGQLEWAIERIFRLMSEMEQEAVLKLAGEDTATAEPDGN